MEHGCRRASRLECHARILGLLLLLVLLPLEFAAADLTFETVGEVASALSFLLLVLDLPIFVLILRRPLVGALTALALATAIVPRQVVLGLRLQGLRQEAAAIVGYAYEHHLTTGEFPPDLEGYESRRPQLMRFVGYEADSDRSGFFLHYWVGTPSTSHWYSPASGWGYYPD